MKQQAASDDDFAEEAAAYSIPPSDITRILEGSSSWGSYEEGEVSDPRHFIAG